MTDIQAQFDALAGYVREVRSEYHLTLGELIDTLQTLGGHVPVLTVGGGSVAAECYSYRGHYSDLALRPDSAPCSVGRLREMAHAVLGQTVEGYKGGDFVMGRDAPLWIAEYGSSQGLAITDIAIEGSPAFCRVRLVTKRVEC